ncbi:BTB/POZ domain-containing protein 8 [Nymphon striatum]|nr:BTB/POZ domain-containing protein 8 [Nymphon striatum]
MASITGGRNLARRSRKGKGQPSEAFVVKCAREREKLRRQLDSDLRLSMQELLTSGNYSDIKLTAAGSFGSNKTSADFHVHSAILKNRVPTFYHENCLKDGESQNSITLPVEKKQLTSFLRKVYCEDDIRIEEVTIVNAIGRSSLYGNKLKNDISPSSYGGDSSDNFLTPLSSIPNIPEAIEKELIDNRAKQNIMNNMLNNNEDIIIPNNNNENNDTVVNQQNNSNIIPDFPENENLLCMNKNSECKSFVLNSEKSSEEERDIKVINSLFSKVKEDAPLNKSLTDSGFLSQTTSIHNDSHAMEAQRISESASEPLSTTPLINTNDGLKTSPIYMYVDIKSIKVADENIKVEQKHVDPSKPRPVSMFIDLNDTEIDTLAKEEKHADVNLRQKTSNSSIQKSVSMFIEAGASPKKSHYIPEHLMSPPLDSGVVISQPTPHVSSHFSRNLGNVEPKVCRHGIYVSPEQESPVNVIKKIQKNEVLSYSKSPQNKCEDKLLLPMSPIMRRKSHKAEPEKQSVMQEVKSSIKPQDVESFKIKKMICESIPASYMEESNLEKESEKRLNEPNNIYDKPVDSTLMSFAVVPLGNISENQETKKLTSPIVDLVCNMNNDKIRSNKDISVYPEDPHMYKKELTSSSPPSESKPKKLIFESNPTISCSENQVPSDLEEDTETVYSEISDLSSIGALSTSTVTLHNSKKGSSEGHSPEEDRRREYRLRGPCSKLGEDLLRMFLEEINTDVIIEVAGKEIKAHKCILTSRCNYFSAMWKNKTKTESSYEKISLPGFSFAGIHFAFCHIYSGATNIPEKSDITELALIADMLGLEGLKHVIVFHLKMAYCHFFHKPCNSCIVGVCECLPISTIYGLTELHDKGIKWIGKHFMRVWPTKSFASLPEELKEKSYQSTISSLSVENVIDIVLSCDTISSTMPQIKWSESISGLVARLISGCSKFISERFDALLNHENFLVLGKGMSWNVVAVEDTIMAAVDNISPDVACRSYVTLNRFLPNAESSENSCNMEWTEKKILRECERYLIHNANHVVHCNSWPLLTTEMQQKIKDAAIIVFEFDKPTAPPPRLSSLNRSFKKNQRQDSGTYSKQSQSQSIEQLQDKKLSKTEHTLCHEVTENKSSEECNVIDHTSETPIKDITKNLEKASSAPVLSDKGEREEDSSFSESASVSVSTSSQIDKDSNKPIQKKKSTRISTAETITKQTAKSSRHSLVAKSQVDQSSKLSPKSGVNNLSCETKERKTNDPKNLNKVNLKYVVDTDSHKENHMIEKTVFKQLDSPQDGLTDPLMLDTSRDDENKDGTEVSSVTSSEWDGNELTSKSIKEAEFLEDALCKKLESQFAEPSNKSKSPPLSQSSEIETTVVRDKTFTRKGISRTRPVSSPAVPCNQEQNRIRSRPKLSTKVMTSNAVTKVQTVRVAGTLTKVSKDSTNQKKSNRNSPPKSK